MRIHVWKDELTRSDRAIAADHLNTDLADLYEYIQPWNIIYAPADIFIAYQKIPLYF